MEDEATSLTNDEFARKIAREIVWEQRSLKRIDDIIEAFIAAAERQPDTDQAPAQTTEDNKPDWYQRCTAEERQRHDLLMAYKQGWLDGDVTDADIAKAISKSADTVRRWRRDLRKAGAPDMDWDAERREHRKRYV